MINNAGASITSGDYGIFAGDGGSSVFNAGTISGGIAAISFAGSGNTLTLAQGSVITGDVLGTGSDTFQLGGTGASTFDVSTLGAQYQGFGAFNKIGSSTWTLTGTTAVVTPWTINQGRLSVSSDGNLGDASGGLALNGGTLQFGASFNLASTRTITVNSVGTIDTNGFSTTISQAITGSGSLTKIGSGTLTLSGSNGYIGGTQVNGGTLVVDGAIFDTTVNAGGTLGGNGSVGNTTINAGGTLSPGSSIGLLTVQGSLVFTAASSYMVEIAPTNADRVNVTGTAALGGATVNASFAAGSYVNRQYTILHAEGGITGRFAGPLVTNLPSGFQYGLSYDATNAYLDLFLNFGNAAALNRNQQNVASALTHFFNTSGGIPVVFGLLTSNGLTQISGEAATGSQQATFNAMGMFMGLLTDPFIAGRGDRVTGGAGVTPFAAENDAAHSYAPMRYGKSERDAYAAIDRKAPPAAEAFAQRWSVWAAGYGGAQTTNGDAAPGSNSATSRIYGAAAGADYRFSPFTVAGFALAGGGTNFAIANGLGSGRSDLFQAGGFVRHTVGPAYLSAALAYGWQDITTDRTLTIAGIDRLRAKFNANAWSGRIEGGYRFVTPWMNGIGITPYAAGQFTTFELPGYAEGAVSGANTFALAYAAKNVSATRSELGLRSDKSVAMAEGIFTLRGRAVWVHDFNTDRNIAATFQTLPGASFVVNGAAQARDAALTTISAEMKWLTGLSLAAAFEGEFSNVTRSYAGKGVARYQW